MAGTGSPSKPSSPYGLSSTTSRSARSATSQDLGAPLERLGDAGRVVEVGDRVQELGLLAGGLQRRHRLPEGDRVETVLVHGDVHDLALVRAEHPERTDVAGRLAEHHVAGVAEHPGDQVETLLGAHGDGDVVGVRGDALQLHHLADRLAEHRFALAGPVLHGTSTVGDHQVVQGVADHIERQVGDVGHPAGQRDDLGSVGHGEQRPDDRGRHAVGAGGVPVHVAVQPGVAALEPLQTRGSLTGEPSRVRRRVSSATQLGLVVSHPPRVPHRRGRRMW